MAVITPVGSMFDWSPKEKEAVVKTASKGAKAQPQTPSDKDLLYAIAKKVVKANFMDIEKIDKPMDVPCGDAPCGESSEVAEVAKGIGEGIGEEIGGGMDGVAPEGVEGVEGIAIEVDDAGAPAGEGVGDVQQAVKELVDKANKAEEVATKVQDAVGKVEEAIQGVKDAVGVTEDAIPDEIEIDIEDDAKEEGETVEHEKSETPAEEKKEEEGGEDIVQESKDEEKPKTEKEACASKKVLEMKSAAAEDDLAKFASLSPSVKKKIYDYWKNDLKYAPDYCKLLVTDN